MRSNFCGGFCLSLTLIAGLPLHLNAVAGLISLLHVTCLLVQRRLLARTNLRGGVLMWHLTPSAEPCCVRRRLGHSSAFTPSIIRIALLAPTLHRCRATQPSHRRLAARSRTNSTFTVAAELACCCPWARPPRRDYRRRPPQPSTTSLRPHATPSTSTTIPRRNHGT